MLKLMNKYIVTDDIVKLTCWVNFWRETQETRQQVEAHEEAARQVPLPLTTPRREPNRGFCCLGTFKRALEPFRSENEPPLPKNGQPHPLFGYIRGSCSWRPPPARRVGSNRPFRILTLHWRSPESSDLRYKSR